MNKSAVETETAILECQVAKEGIQGTWHKDGLALQKSEHVAFEENGTERKLVIQNVTCKDVGTYSFKFGSVSTSARLDVRGG